MNFSYGELRASDKLPGIVQIIGSSHRRDPLHLDSAYKSACRAFVTRDTDILNHANALEKMLGIVIVNPDKDDQKLIDVLDSEAAV